MTKAILFFYSHKRHINVFFTEEDNSLCGVYCGLETAFEAKERSEPDRLHNHTTGLIPLVPMSEQPFKVETGTICKKCLAKFEKKIRKIKRKENI